MDFGDGTKRDINISLVNVKLGEYVIVHAGFAIQVLEKREAEESIKLWNQILEQP